MGRTFPDYAGPIEREWFASRCLVCGRSEIGYQIIIPDEPTRFGLCSEHFTVFDAHQPVSDRGLPLFTVQTLIVTAGE